MALDGLDDADVLQAGIQSKRAILTRNCSDYLELHQTDATHSGIIGVYHDGDPTRWLTYKEVAHAIENLENSGHEIANNYHSLNQWHY